MLAKFFAHLRQQWMGALALFLVLAGGTAYAANTVGSADIIDDSILSQDVKDGQIKQSDVGDNAVKSGKVADNSLTTADIAGADVNGGHINIGAGQVANGRCKQLNAAISGAKAGEAVIFSAQGALQNGIVLYGQGVPSAGIVTFDACNFSGTTQNAITNFPVRVITFG
jgi:hypothetical protein